MLLLTIKEWLGFRDEESHYLASYKTEYEKTKGFVTNLKLSDAIDILTQYKEYYCCKYPNAKITFSLISVSKIEQLNQDQLDNMGLDLIEQMQDYILDDD